MKQSYAVLLVVLVLTTFCFGKDKKKQAVPDAVLRAETVAVMILPDAGEPVMNPSANRDAVDAVEKALTKWGRFRVEMTPYTADLVIGVRTGHGSAATPTIQGGGIDNRDVIMQRSDSTIRIGGQNGNPGTGTGFPNDGPRSGMEVGPTTDYLEVRLGGGGNPLQGARVWTYSGKNALQAPGVTALAKFREAIEETEKQKKKP